MKAYTDLQQSRKLAEILPLESADMIWVLANPDLPMIKAIAYEDSEKSKYYEILPAWSLAALRSFLPCGVNINNTLHVFESHKTFDNDWVYVYKFENSEPLYTKASSEIDACYEMIIKLKERNLL